jgi:hypothetical protein
MSNSMLQDLLKYSLPPNYESVITERNLFDYSREEYDRADTNPPPLCTKSWFLRSLEIKPSNWKPSNLVSDNSRFELNRLSSVSLDAGNYGGIIQSIFFSSFDIGLTIYLFLHKPEYDKLTCVREINISDIESGTAQQNYTGGIILLDPNSQLLIYQYHPSPGSISYARMTLSGGWYE